MKKLGKKQLTLHLLEPLTAIPAALADWHLELNADGCELQYTFETHEERTGIPALLRRLDQIGLGFTELQTRQSSLDDIFVSLVSNKPRIITQCRRLSRSRWRASSARSGRAW